jgi:hypothetical protein
LASFLFLIKQPYYCVNKKPNFNWVLTLYMFMKKDICSSESVVYHTVLNHT